METVCVDFNIVSGFVLTKKYLNQRENVLNQVIERENIAKSNGKLKKKLESLKCNYKFTQNSEIMQN